MIPYEYIYRQLAEMFDEPCNFSGGTCDIDIFMIDNCSDYCDEVCGNHNGAKCWEKFFEASYNIDKKRGRVDE